MGTNAAVSLANFYLARKLDSKISTLPQVIYFKRYIDDIKLFWIGSLTDWSHATEMINNIHPSINITFTEPSLVSCDFLDITISYNLFTLKLDTSIYQKPLNKFLYITPKSTHEPHTLSGFIKGELTRYCRLCNNVYSYAVMKMLFKSRLLKRGYSNKFISLLFSKHHWYYRALPPKQSSNIPIIPFVIPFTFRGNQNELRASFYKYAQNLSDDFYCKPRFIYSKSKNLLSFLSFNSLSTEQSNELSRIKRRETR